MEFIVSRVEKLRYVWMVAAAILFSGVWGVQVAKATPTYTASVSTGAINMSTTAAGVGAKVSTNNVTVISTCPSGYTLSVKGAAADTTLYKDGDSSNSESNNSTNYIEASNGTKNNPVGITGNNLNTWGYTLTHGNNINNDTFIGLTDTFTELTTSAEATTSSGTTIPVYYGVSVSADRAAGTYKMASNAPITYALVTSLDCTSYQVAFNSNGGTGTMQNQRIAEETATALTTNSFTGPSATPYFAGWNTAADGTGTDYTNGETVTDLTTVGQTITLYAQWTDCPAGNICYNDNGANSTTKMGNQSIGTDATSADLWASNFQRSGYGFLGWSTKANPTIGTDNIYGPMETISNINVSQGGIKLYAVWKAAETTTVGETTTPVYLQDWNGCNDLTAATYNSTTGKITVTQNSFIALTDKRDDQVYAIAKLADGACWMIENLRLDTAGTVGDNKHDSNVTNRSLAQGYGDVFAGLADPETANFSNSATANSLYYIGTRSGTATININQNYSKYSDCRMPRYRNDNTVLAEGETDTATGNDVDTYAYGNYYTWAAAIADTTHYTSNGHTTVATSICPKGWHLPYGNSGNSGSNLGNTKGGFYYLNQQMGKYTNGDGSKEFRSFPNNFLYSGNADGSDISNRGSGGRYWSSSAFNANYAYYLGLRSSYLYPGTDFGSKYSGLTVRCVVGS